MRDDLLDDMREELPHLELVVEIQPAVEAQERNVVVLVVALESRWSRPFDGVLFGADERPLLDLHALRSIALTLHR